MSNKRKIEAAKLSELANGEMKEIDADGTKILLARDNDKCYAIGARCTHYGAPLAEGFLSGKRIVCPWHHACFNITTGRPEEPPAFDSLPRFDVEIEDDRIFVILPAGNPPDRIPPPMIKRSAKDKRLFVILGGGAAGFMAAQTLRQDGFTGRILMITRENRLPYDRPNLTKDYLQGHAEPEWMPLRSEDFFAENDIEIVMGKEATSVDALMKKIVINDGEIIEYDSLLVATGGTPRRLPFQLDKHVNVFLLRSFSDADAIIETAGKGKRAVVIGASFIGMETAASLRSRGCEVTIVAPDKIPFEKILGAEIGSMFQRIHEQNGVSFKLGAGVKSFEGDNKIESIVLEDGEHLEADFVVVGIGIRPATDFLKGVKFHKDGGVIVDEFLRAAEDLYAAGDIAHFPDSRSAGGHDDKEKQKLVRIEHWRTAMQQGKTAARNIMGGRQAFTAVPFFWTTQFDATLNYVGHVNEWDTIIFRGDVEKQDFLAFYIKNDRIRAIAGMNRDSELAFFEEQLRLDRMLSPEQLNEPPVDGQSIHPVPGLF